jgi:hypothetical protein
MDADCFRMHRKLLDHLLVIYMDKVIDNLVGFRGRYSDGILAWVAPRDNPGVHDLTCTMHSLAEVPGEESPSP